jgi:hypothetical protein
MINKKISNYTSGKVQSVLPRDRSDIVLPLCDTEQIENPDTDGHTIPLTGQECGTLLDEYAKDVV